MILYYLFDMQCDTDNGVKRKWILYHVIKQQLEL